MRTRGGAADNGTAGHERVLLERCPWTRDHDLEARRRARVHDAALVLDELGRHGTTQIGASGTGQRTAVTIYEDRAVMDDAVHLRGHPLPRSDMGPLFGHESSLRRPPRPGQLILRHGFVTGGITGAGALESG